MKRLILAHDLGTTGNKATLFDERARMVARAFSGYETRYPRPGWAEQDPGDWWRAVVETTRRLLAESHAPPDEIAAIGLSGQMQGCLPVDAAGRPLRACLIWADQRATEQAARLTERVGAERVYRITGHRISPTYTLAKLLWLRDHEPELYARTAKVLHVKDYIAFRLAGRVATDRSDASGMNLYDLDAGRWSDEILNAVALDPARLPAIHDSTDVIGELTRTAADELGLRAGMPVVIGGGDGASAAAGAGAVGEGPAYAYLGSSAWISFASPRPLYDRQQRIFNFAHMVPGLFAPCGTMQAAGGSYQWLRRRFFPDGEQPPGASSEDAYARMDREAAASAPGAHGLLFLPYLQGERSPHWNPDARGAFIGLQIGHTRGDLIRAVLEGVAFNLRTILLAFLEAGARIEELTVIGGGARSALWRQILADVLGRPVLRPRLLEEATSLGAALAAGVGVGLYDWSLARENLDIVERHAPDPAAQAAYEPLYPLFRESYDALAGIFDRLARAEAATR